MDVKTLLLAASVVLTFSCERPTRSQVENRLKEAMKDRLYRDINYDSSKVKYDIREVIYFEEAKSYECEFKVRLTTSRVDTTGIMTASITKDFKQVLRKS